MNPMLAAWRDNTMATSWQLRDRICARSYACWRLIASHGEVVAAVTIQSMVFGNSGGPAGARCLRITTSEKPFFHVNG
ncbi:hypothetical protein [Rhodoferax ferrireducens]|nr:hypothetical protein [Rhodoferax ferrireducens]